MNNAPFVVAATTLMTDDEHKVSSKVTYVQS